MIDTYDKRLAPVRAAFGRKVEQIIPDHEFFIRFSAYGVGMTEKVDGWIRRAGERCVALGFPDIGKALITHARHEEGHHRMMLADLATLGGDPLLAAPPWPPGVEAYRRMHEGIIASTAPWGQIAVEYEIEALSVEYGPRFLEQSPAHLTFVDEHVALDEAHTAYNRKHMAALLERRPDFLDSLVDCGARALLTYGQFLEDCAKGDGVREREFATAS